MASDENEEAKRRARMALVAMAERAREQMTAMQWEDSIAETPEGLLVGPREIEAISRLIFGKRKRRFF